MVVSISWSTMQEDRLFGTFETVEDSQWQAAFEFNLLSSVRLIDVFCLTCVRPEVDELLRS